MAHRLNSSFAFVALQETFVIQIVPYSSRYLSYHQESTSPFGPWCSPRLVLISLDTHIITDDVTQSFTTPPAVSRIPNEILGAVFAIHLNGTIEELHYLPFRSFRRSILAVCRRWRRVALSNPLCWTTLNLAYDGTSMINFRVEPLKAMAALTDILRNQEELSGHRYQLEEQRWNCWT